MELTPDQLGAGFVGVVVLLGALGQYIRSKQENPKADPVLQGIVGEFGNREQTERIIACQTRIAAAIEILADKRTEEISDMHKALLERLDAQERREEQEEPGPRRQPPRRRT